VKSEKRTVKKSTQLNYYTIKQLSVSTVYSQDSRHRT